MEEEKIMARVTEEGEKVIVDLSSMPEGVIAYILSLTNPPDVCRSSAVSRTFCAAAQSDIVWDSFLPSDSEKIIYNNFDPSSFSSKKDIFLSLFNHPLLIDDSKKSFALDRWSGKNCLMLGGRDMFIVWSDKPQNWIWESHPDSRFPEVAVLLDVLWFEIRGKISSSILSSATTYVAYFVFKMKKGEYFGFNIDPIDATVGIVGGEHSTKSICLDPYLNNPHRRRRRMLWAHMDASENMLGLLQQPRERSDGWHEIELGEFQNEGGDDEVEISLTETKGNFSKRGLIVHGIEIRPKISHA